MPLRYRRREPHLILGTALEQLRKKRIARLPSKRRKNNDLVFSNLLFEGRCSIQLSYGRADDRSDSKPFLDIVSSILAWTVAELCQNLASALTASPRPSGVNSSGLSQQQPKFSVGQTPSPAQLELDARRRRQPVEYLRGRRVLCRPRGWKRRRG
jgi:hypothetical protein